MNSIPQKIHSGPSAKPTLPQAANLGLLVDWEDLREGLQTAASMIRPTVTGIMLLFIVLFSYAFTIHEMRFYAVTTHSMEPTFKAGDCIFTVAARKYNRGDIIVFNDPVTPGAYITKRIVGVGGDTLTIEQSTLFVNGEPVHEPYLAEPMNYAMWAFTVPDGEVFVLGDNRNASDDSYAWWRAVPLREVRGRVVQIYMPFDRLRHIGDQTMAFAGL